MIDTQRWAQLSVVFQRMLDRFEELSSARRAYFDYETRHPWRCPWSRTARRLERDVEAASLAHKTAVRLFHDEADAAQRMQQP